MAEREIAFETKTFVEVTHESCTMGAMMMPQALLVSCSPHIRVEHASRGCEIKKRKIFERGGNSIEAYWFPATRRHLWKAKRERKIIFHSSKEDPKSDATMMAEIENRIESSSCFDTLLLCDCFSKERKFASSRKKTASVRRRRNEIKEKHKPLLHFYARLSEWFNLFSVSIFYVS